MVKNPYSNAGDAGSISGQVTKILHATGQLSLYTATTEPVCSGASKPKRNLCAAMKIQYNQKEKKKIIKVKICLLFIPKL